MDDSHIGLLMLSVFCAGGLYAYVREVLRLRRLISSGKVAQATILKKEKIDSGSESIVHFFVKYEFVDDQGKTIIHEQDMNSRKFFSTVSPGSKIEVLYQTEPTDSSYPLTQIQADLKIAQWISVGILVFWGLIGAILV